MSNCSNRILSPSRRGCLLFSLALVLFVGTAAVAPRLHAADQAEPKLDLRYRWIFYLGNLLPDKNVDDLIAVCERGAKCGYNGLLVADSKFMSWDALKGTNYNANVKRLHDACTRLHMQFIVSVAPMSNDLLSYDPNLAEGLPAREVPFLVKDGKLVPDPALDVPISNAGFENWNQNGPIGWSFVDGPGKCCCKDTEVKCEGTASLRMDDIQHNSPNQMGRICHALKVRPWTNYHVHARVKTKDFASAGQLECKVLTPDGWSLNEYASPVKPTQDWSDFDAVFNSLDHTDVNFYIGVWGGRTGTLWIDDVSVTPAGLVNVLRRPGTPVTITSEDKATTYVEGKDYSKIVDPKMGNQPWPGAYSVWHEPPTVTLPAGSALKEGQRVLVSYFQPPLIGDWGAVMACLSAPGTMKALQWQADQVKEHSSPDGYFMSYDEMRCQGWDDACADRKMTCGQILADNIKQVTAMYRKLDPDKPLFVWSDMFDPYHNAQKTGKYYLVHGDGPWYDSWQGLDPSVIVANWNSAPAHRLDSLKFFADRGNRQILSGYYDSDVHNIDPWLRDAGKVKGVVGVMYTTWENNYSQLEAFAAEFKKFEGPENPANDDKPAAPPAPAVPPPAPEGAAPTPATPSVTPAATPAAIPATASAALVPAPAQPAPAAQAKVAEVTPPDDKTAYYIGMAVGVLAVLAVVFLAVRSGSKRASGRRRPGGASDREKGKSGARPTGAARSNGPTRRR
ncbi:MAG: hypothetical protein ACREJ2_11100 [Planctomycetota bacterium]